MKITLEMPSVFAGIVLGMLISAVSVKPWIMNFDNAGSSTFIAIGLLAVAGGWLTIFGDKAPALLGMMARSAALRGAGSQDQMVQPDELPSNPNLQAPAERPLEWMQKANESEGAEGLGWEKASALLQAQLPDNPIRDGIIRALTLAIRLTLEMPRSKAAMEAMATAAWASLKNGVTPDFSKLADDLLESFPKLRIARIRDDRHHFGATRLIAEIDAARRSGQFVAAAELRWVKAFDRPLYYAISNLGRTTMFLEGAGISSHYAAEKKAGHRLPQPDVEAALTGLEQYFRERDLISEVRWVLT
ncbi:hypothetical protein ACVIGB_001067 [Bradyrhizobium sp. USDA 4341]